MLTQQDTIAQFEAASGRLRRAIAGGCGAPTRDAASLVRSFNRGEVEIYQIQEAVYDAARQYARKRLHSFSLVSICSAEVALDATAAIYHGREQKQPYPSIEDAVEQQLKLRLCAN